MPFYLLHSFSRPFFFCVVSFCTYFCFFLVLCVLEEAVILTICSCVYHHVCVLLIDVLFSFIFSATLATLANSAASLGHAASAAAAANNAAAAAGVAVPTLTTEMTIPNDIIGSVIGKGGAKINEIR